MLTLALTNSSSLEIAAQPPSAVMADPSDLNLDAPSDLQDIPDLAMQLIPPPEGTYPDKSVQRRLLYA